MTNRETNELRLILYPIVIVASILTAWFAYDHGYRNGCDCRAREAEATR